MAAQRSWLRRVGRALAPSLISLGVHLALLAALASVTLTLTLDAAPLARAFTALAPIEDTVDAQEPITPADIGSAPFRTAQRLDAPRAEPPPQMPSPAVAAAPKPPTRTPPARSAGAPDPARALAEAVRARPRTIDFAGVATQSARSVVFVVDASGAMTTSMPFVLAELERSLAALGPTQRFQVVVFRDRSAIDPSDRTPALAFGNGQLLEPTPAVRAAVASWLDSLKLGGRSTPLPGLERALAMQPDAIFLLSRSIARTQDGTWDVGTEILLERLDRLNPSNSRGQRRTRIHAIQFIDPDPTNLMPTLAQRHGGAGAYALRSLDELSILSRRPPPVDTDAGFDRALAALAELSRTGADLFTLYGLATPTQRLAASRAAATALANLPTGDEQPAIALVLRARVRRLMGEPVELIEPPAGWPDDPTLRTLVALAEWRAPSMASRFADAPVRAEAAIARVRFAQGDIAEAAANARAELAAAGVDNDLLWRTLLADAAALALVESRAPDEAQVALERLLDDPALGDLQQREAVIDQRLDLLLERFSDLAPATARAQLVAAERALAAGDRARAIELLRAVGTRPATQRLVEVLAAGPPADLLEAARLSPDPDDASALARQAEQATASGSADRLAVVAAYAAILERTLAGATQHAAFWQAERSRLALERAASRAPLAALDLLATIEPGTADPLAVLEAIRLASATGEARDRAILLYDRWDTRTAIRARRDRANELKDAEPARAEAIYRELLALPISHLPDRAVVALNLAELLVADDRPRDAFDLAMPIARARLTPQDPIGWRAWTVALEAIVAAGDAAASDEVRADARAHLLRLRSLDPQRGGTEWAMRLDAVEQALAR